MARWETSNYFKDYAEDYNTATFPHSKYYDYDKWEMEEYQRQKETAATAAAGGSRVMQDEWSHRQEVKARAEQKRLLDLEQTKALMSHDKVEEMKRQAQLRHELSLAYKTGDETKRKQLQKRLEPEDKQGAAGAGTAHPWAK